MKVVLQVSDQYGPDGPQQGARGTCLQVRKIEGDYYAYVLFEGFNDWYICFLDHLMSVNTENTESFHTT